jgi:hypothetical protein
MEKIGIEQNDLIKAEEKSDKKLETKIKTIQDQSNAASKSSHTSRKKAQNKR